LYIPLVKPLGVNGAAAAACEEIAVLLTGIDKAEGVKAGESTFRLFLILLDAML
jgi:hypothetical protein